jgi:PQ loop repeat
MMLLWACAGVPLGVYNIVENFNIALRIQPQILTFLSLVTWMQCKYYGSKWPVAKLLAITVPMATSMGGIEYGLIFGLRKSEQEQVRWPIIFMAVLSACLLCAGVLRHYWDIYRERTVRGISFIFVLIDALGDLTSLISLFFEPRLDVLGMVIYGSELVLWCGVMACGGYYNFRPWIRNQLHRRASKRRARHISGEHHMYSQNEDEAVGRSSSTVFRTASSIIAVGPADQETLGPTRLRNVDGMLPVTVERTT